MVSHLTECSVITVNLFILFCSFVYVVAVVIFVRYLVLFFLFFRLTNRNVIVNYLDFWCVHTVRSYFAQWARERETTHAFQFEVQHSTQPDDVECRVIIILWVCVCAYMALSIYKTEWFWNFNNSSFWTFRAHRIVQVIKITFVVSVCVWQQPKISLPSFSLPLAPHNFGFGAVHLWLVTDANAIAATVLFTWPNHKSEADRILHNYLFIQDARRMRMYPKNS